MHQQERGLAAAPLRLLGFDVDPLGLDVDLVALDRLHHGASVLQWVEDHAGQQLGIEVGRFLRHHVAGHGDRRELFEPGGTDQDGGLRLAGVDRAPSVSLVPSVGEPIPGRDGLGIDP